MSTRQIYASRGGTNYKPYDIASDAPLQAYTIPGHGINTYSLNDQGGTPWYLTDGGNWRNTQTKKLSPTAPTYQASTPAPPPAAPEPGVPNNTQPQQTFRSIWDFALDGTENLFKPRVEQTPLNPGRVDDFLPTNPQASATYRYAVDQGTKEANKRLAAKGVLGSGYEDEVKLDIAARAAAEDIARQVDLAKTSYGANTQANLEGYRQGINETNNLRNLMTNLMGIDYGSYNAITEADKDRELERDSQGLGFLQTVLDFQKSLNPMQYGYPATTTAANSYNDLAGKLSSLALAGSGGGGGGARYTPPPYMAPGATSQSGTRDLIQMGGQILPSLIDAFRNF